jgi:hypothetical protein
MQLAKGRYLVIPYTESTPYNGPFTLAVATKHMDDIGFHKIPKNPADDWKSLRVAVLTFYPHPSPRANKNTGRMDVEQLRRW